MAMESRNDVAPSDSGGRFRAGRSCSTAPDENGSASYCNLRIFDLYRIQVAWISRI